MIYESHPWKQEINRHCRLITTWSERIETQRGYFYVERSVFLYAFIIRKLIENNKLSDRIRDKSIDYASFRSFRPVSDRIAGTLGVFDISKEYDLENPSEGKASIYDICSEIMHSFVFVPQIGAANTMDFFYVNSFRQQDKRLLRIDSRKYMNLLNDVTNDGISQSIVWKDKHGKFRVDTR